MSSVSICAEERSYFYKIYVCRLTQINPSTLQQSCVIPWSFKSTFRKRVCHQYFHWFCFKNHTVRSLSHFYCAPPPFGLRTKLKLLHARACGFSELLHIILLSRVVDLIDKIIQNDHRSLLLSTSEMWLWIDMVQIEV